MDNIMLNDDLDFLDVIEFGYPRQIYIRSEPFHDMDNLSFFRRFRLTKPTVLNLLAEIEDDLEFNNDLNNSISPMNQLLTCLRYYASAGHLISVADAMGMHVSTTSRIIPRVSNALCRLARNYIKMPAQAEMIHVQHQFHQMASFPRVIGCLDGTHIKIQSPGGEDVEVFRNRKGYFSINTQAVCSSNLKILDLVARWPGSTHDATIFMNSRLRARFENNEFPNCLLLGDSGYPVKTYLLTPLGNPTTRVEQLYNESHIRTRNCIERVFGVWKRRFPVLAYGLRLKLQTALQIIVAAAVLHNIARENNEPEPPPPENINVAELNYLIEVGQIPDIPNNNFENAGFRDVLLNDYFSNLV
ncbi:hypothetical protein NQ315_014917 [Exocentrus adspersus]|uniref:DDE Tnp4 domain-containing protein n=1 Tax=Exocentrus adspersus TaxID=1586481 RepID=A0AAV8V6V1_9CUCU|nr:hypothetical protein NQ315_014917 [Exocentrus adspersus]